LRGCGKGEGKKSGREIMGREWNGKGRDKEGVNHPTKNPGYATTLGYSGPRL